MTDSPKPQQGAYASCCVLSYNRPEMLRTAVASLIENAEAPLELIIHDDGSDDGSVYDLLRELLHDGWATVIQNPPGHNQGVGEAVRRMFAVATGDPLIKIDQDLIFEPGWLATINRTFYEAALNEEAPRLGCLGGFRYYVEPVRHELMHVNWHEGWEEVGDFVSSMFAVPRWIYERHGPFPTHSAAFAEDIEFKKHLQSQGFALGLTENEICTNRGFGIGPSTVVRGEGDVEPIHQQPVIHT